MKILFVLRTLPYPIERDGLTLINYRLLKFAPSNYEFDIISLSNEDTNCIDNTYSINIQIKNIMLFPDDALNHSSKRISRLLFSCIQVYDDYLDKNADKYDMIYTCLPPSALFLTNRRYKTPLFVNAVDSFSMLNLRFYKYNGRLADFIKYYFYVRAEKRCFKKAQLINFVSDVDRNFTEKMICRDGLIAIPNGVDVDYFKMDGTTNRQSENLLFIGNFKNISNVLSMNYFCNEVYPIIKKSHPNLKMFIVGPHAPFNFEDKSIIVTGFVDDLREYYHKCTLFVSPLVTGSGIKNKVLEAMAAGIPVITSNIGVDGIAVIPGKHVIVANSTQEWVDSISAVLNDSDLRMHLSENSKRYVLNGYDWNMVVKRYYSSFEYLIEKNNI